MVTAQPLDRTLEGRADSAEQPGLDVSIVLPCLNEEATVAICVEKARKWFKRSGRHGEVIVVDNGSTDRSREVALGAGARVIDETQRGYGAALRLGFSQARGQYIVMADADDTYDLLNLDPLIEPLQNGYDMTVGNRLKTMDSGSMSWSHRVVGTPTITFLLGVFSGSRLGDSQCGLRAFTREAYESMDLRAPGMELASEMIMKAARRGLRAIEVPIPYAVRQGESKLRTFRDGWRHLRFLLLNTPVYLFLVPGALAVALGIFALAITLAAESGVTIGTLTWQPVFAGSILLIIGTNALTIGAASHLYAASRQIIPEDWLTIWFSRFVTLERLLLGALLLVVVGLGIDAVIFYQWVSRHYLFGVSTVGLAALAQTSIIMGANVAMGGFLIALMDER